MTAPKADPDDPNVSTVGNQMRSIAQQDVSRRSMMVASAAGAGMASLSGCVSGLGGGGSGADGEDGSADGEAETPNYVVTSHIYTTHDIGNFQHTHFGASCAPQYQFVPGQLVGFRVGIWDPDTGDQLTNDDVDGVSISFEGPTSFDDIELEWNGDDEEHPAEQWSARLRQTEGAEPGQYKYTVHVTDDDANYRYVGIWENTFTLIDPEQAPPTATPTPDGA